MWKTQVAQQETQKLTSYWSRQVSPSQSFSADRSGLAIHSFSCLKLFNGFLLPPEESQPSLMSHGPFMTCSLFLVQHHLSAPCPPFPAFYASATLLWVFQFIRFSFHELSTKVIFSGKLPWASCTGFGLPAVCWLSIPALTNTHSSCIAL